MKHGDDFEEYMRQISGFPARAKKLLKGTGMTQRDFARKIGMHEVEVSRYFTGKTRGGLSLYLAWKISRGLGVGIDRLFFGRTATRARAALPPVREYPVLRKEEKKDYEKIYDSYFGADNDVLCPCPCTGSRHTGLRGEGPEAGSE